MGGWDCEGNEWVQSPTCCCTNSVKTQPGHGHSCSHPPDPCAWDSNLEGLGVSEGWILSPRVQCPSLLHSLQLESRLALGVTHHKSWARRGGNVGPGWAEAQNHFWSCLELELVPCTYLQRYLVHREGSFCRTQIASCTLRHS